MYSRSSFQSVPERSMSDLCTVQADLPHGTMMMVKIIPLILSPFTLRERHSTALEFVNLQ